MQEASSPPTPPAGVAEAGAVLGGRYALVHRLASGGMAEVWEGDDTVLQRRVAIKLLYPHLAADPSFLARFRSEALSAARLHHHGIVAIYDTVSEPRAEAIVMELVRGPSLRQHLDRQKTLVVNEAIRIGVNVAEALGVAHQAGIVHRDIKPANILLSDDGRVLVTDFGIAKLVHGADLTQTGTMLGSVKYLAPEQVEGGAVDGRTDLYALGVVLYEALAGVPPFVSDTPAATALLRLQRDPAPVQARRQEVPPALAQVVHRALARSPGDRYPDAASLRRALLDAQRADPAPAPRPAGSPARAPARPAAPGTSAAPVPPGHEPTRVAAAPAGARPPAPRPAAPHPAPAPRRRQRRSVVPMVFAAVMVAAIVVAGILLYRTTVGEDVLTRLADDTGIELPGARPSGALTITGLATFDPPPGDGTENDELLALAADGDPSTAWRTERYDTRALGGLKPGVGVVVTLEEAARLRRLEVGSPTSGWAAEIYVADVAGATLVDWGDPVASQTGIAGDATFDLGGAEGGVVLVWVTDLGGSEGRPAAEISTVEVFGT